MKILLNTVLFFFLFVSQVQALIRPPSWEEVLDQADFVIVGKVIDIKTGWNNEKKIEVFTDYEIEVEENIKGDLPSKIMMKFTRRTLRDWIYYNRPTNTMRNFPGVNLADQLSFDKPVVEVGETCILLGYGTKGKYYSAIKGVYKVIYDDIQDVDYVVSHNGYLLEINESFEIRGGPLYKFDSDGAVVGIKPKEKKKKRKIGSEPYIVDKDGNKVPLVRSPSPSTFPRKGRFILQKSVFIDFLRRKIERKDLKGIITDKVRNTPPVRLIEAGQGPEPIN
jgi:hypothetical protein